MSSTRQLLLTRLFIFMACFFLMNCNESKKSGNSNGGSSGESPPAVLLPTVTIATDLANITATNAVNFMLSGTCSEENQPITVVVDEGEEDLSPETAPLCTNGSWMAEVDVSSLNSGPSRVIAMTADHASLGGQNATQATGSVLLPPRVFIATDLEEITTDNVDDFTVSGTCSEEGESITVVVGGISPTTTPTCTNEAWSIRVDLSSLAAGRISITVNHSTSNDLAALQATGDVLLSPTVSVSTTLADITASNADDFTVSGSCSEDGQPVTVVAGEVSPATAPICTTGGWTTKLDMTGLNKMTEVSITASHVSEDGVTSAEDTGSVTNDFICPSNYVGVPSLSGYTTNSFCLMKYEAKNNSGSAASQVSGTPHISITRDESISKCTGLNSAGENKHDLITNDEWQTLARNIELVGDNWSTGVVGNAEGLNRGHSDAVPNNALAANSDDNMSCHGTGQTCNSTTWESQRRTHTLSNGEVIWDVAGNVREWIKDSNGSSYGYATYISKVTATTHTASNSLSNGTTTTSRNAKAQFGPSGDYTSFDTEPYGGLGYGALNFSTMGFFRGGSWNGGASAGVFTVDLGYLLDSRLTNVGFRCAFHP